MRAFCFLVIIIVIAGTPIRVNASFLNSVSSFIFGKGAQASDNINTEYNPDDFGTDNFEYNSQNMQVLGNDSVDPNIKNIASISDVIINNDALSVDNNYMGMGLENVSNGEMSTYVVEEGDTLSEIAMLHDVSVNTIRWENNITGQTIRVGQKLNILPVTGVKHIVKSGDTLDKVAVKYDAEVEDIMVFNDITKSDKLKVGDILYVPNGVIKAVVVQKNSNNKVINTINTVSTTNVESGYYLRPTAGPVTSPYGPRKLGYHYGIDIGASRGTKVVAAASGRVIKTLNYCIEGKSSCGGRYGNYVVIEHSNGTRTTYAHLAKVSVSVGTQVSRGETIGSVGNTGRSTGPHLHFEIEKSNGSTIRPSF